MPNAYLNTKSVAKKTQISAKKQQTVSNVCVPKRLKLFSQASQQDNCKTKKKIRKEKKNHSVQENNKNGKKKLQNLKI